MTKKVLFVATVLKKHIDQFHIPYIEYFKNLGYEVYVAASNDYGEEGMLFKDCYNFIEVDFSRNPFSPNNLKAYRQMKKIVCQGKYEIIHCHTPVASVVTRLAARRERKKGTRVIYTAHGFQFVKGGPKRDWLFLPVEIYAGFFTDDLITINGEDYNRAKKCIPAKNIHHINGVGVSLEKFEYKPKKRSKNDQMIISYVAELIPRKNHKLLIDLAKIMQDEGVCFEMWFIGEGEHKEKLIDYAKKMKVLDKLKFLGYRRDVPDLLHQTDLVISTSYREGLPVNILEAYASGVPVITTDSRGSRDIVMQTDKKLISNFCPKSLYSKVLLLLDEEYRQNIISKQKLVIEEYSIDYALEKYNTIINNYK